MSCSILREFEAKKINYSAQSLTQNSNYNPYNVFSSDNKFFHSSSSPSDQWWQVKFDKQVTINSYTISAYSNINNRPTKWVINTSNDGQNWDSVPETGNDILNNQDNFTLSSPVSCSYFRIILKQNTFSDNQFLFSYFDCFGLLARDKNAAKLHSCLNQNRKYRISYNMIVLTCFHLLNT